MRIEDDDMMVYIKSLDSVWDELSMQILKH